MANILVVEDERALCDFLVMNLRLVGHTVGTCDDGEKVLSIIEQNRPDLILLDVMLPGRDGFDLMKEIEPLGIPVIFLTAKERVEDRVVGLKLGADDYIVKPFATVEVFARIDAVLKRTGAGNEAFRLNALEVRFAEHLVLLGGKPVDLTAKEFDLLEVFIKNRNILLSRDRLLELVWGYDYFGETRTVDTHVQKLRKKLKLDDTLKTVYKAGYRLEVPR